jgi:hypothetical protein
MGPSGATISIIFFSASVGSYRKSTANDLSHGGDVWRDVEQTLGAVGADPESGDDLVKDQECAVVLGDLSQSFQEPRCGWYDAHVSGHWLCDDGGDSRGVGGKKFLNRLNVIVFSDQGFAGVGFRNAGAGGDTMGQCARACFDEQAVGVAVVTPGELDDFVPASESTGQANGAHACLSSRADQAD